jgi:hypothetical protein
VVGGVSPNISYRNRERCRKMGRQILINGFMLALLIITILTDELVCMLLLKVKADISKF